MISILKATKIIVMVANGLEFTMMLEPTLQINGKRLVPGPCQWRASSCVGIVLKCLASHGIDGGFLGKLARLAKSTEHPSSTTYYEGLSNHVPT